MRGQQSVETPVPVPATVVWGAYRGLELSRLINQLPPDVLGKVQVLEGDGGVGTTFKLTLPPGTPGSGYLKEMFTKMDDDKLVKETKVVEGGFKNIGFDLSSVRFEIIVKDAESIIIRSTIEYHIRDAQAHHLSFLSTKLEIMAQTIAFLNSEE